jgi:hypothetical protein
MQITLQQMKEITLQPMQAADIFINSNPAPRK